MRLGGKSVSVGLPGEVSMRSRFGFITIVLLSTVMTGYAEQIPPQERDRLSAELRNLQAEHAEQSKAAAAVTRFGAQQLADSGVCLKAVEWMLRHDECPKPDYIRQADAALDLARERLKSFGQQQQAVPVGRMICGYRSAIDDSLQPYALTLPAGVNPRSGDRWPLYVVLHGRSNDMNEVNFIHRHQGKPVGDGQTWIQLDVYGRGNNAYRWGGETDVFEAMADVMRRFRIDHRRVVLHGFSMGGAGAWHLGVHYPDRWAAVGAGAGFADFYRYQKKTELRPPWQHISLRFYDAVSAAPNAFNVPMIGYGGEKDPQRLAAEMMAEAAAEKDISIPVLIGPGMGHKFDAASQAAFMEFLAKQAATGLPGPGQRNEIRLTIPTLKHSRCDWLKVDEVIAPTTIAEVRATKTDDGRVIMTTQNVQCLQLNRDVASTVVIDGTELPLSDAAEGLLPDVYYVRKATGWDVLGYRESRRYSANPDRRKRSGLQGPIDDAFTGRFLCVKGTGTPFDQGHQEWVDAELSRFRREYDQWMRADLPVVPDTDVTEEQIDSCHLVLFGDPSSNSLIRRVVKDLPIDGWEPSHITVGGHEYPTDSHGISLISANPLNPRRYVVINSGHTFTEKDFRSSNSWLFPRLGDLAIRRFAEDPDGAPESQVRAAAILDAGWQLKDLWFPQEASSPE